MDHRQRKGWPHLHLLLLATCMLFTGCRTPPPELSPEPILIALDPKPTPELLSIELDDVPLLDVLRMCRGLYKRISSNGPLLTEDSLPREELESVRVTLKATDVTRKEILQRVAKAARLRIEWERDSGQFRVQAPAR